jgi:NADH dehydrogenase [ubiquinone] 1 alpha subcomplex assembly factor 3
MTASTTFIEHNFLAYTTPQQSIAHHLTSPHLTMERNLFTCTRSLPRHLTQMPSRNASRSRPCTFAARQRHTRYLHTTRPLALKSQPPKTRDRGPKSDEDTQTDFSALDVLRNTVAPATSIDACTSDGFALNNQMRISGSGVLLIGGEAFRWRPWREEGREGDDREERMAGKLLNAKGQWEVQEGAWGVLELCWPKPGRSL